MVADWAQGGSALVIFQGDRNVLSARWKCWFSLCLLFWGGMFMSSADLPVTRTTQVFDSLSGVGASTSVSFYGTPFQSSAPVVHTKISRTVHATSTDKVPTFAVIHAGASVITVLPTGRR